MKDIEIIRASAGSGKTYTLTQRILEATNGQVRPSEIVGTTFTRKAAAELQQRLRQAFIGAHRSDDALELQNGFVGTINSICGQWLQDYALENGLSPDVQILPEEVAALAFQVATAEAIDRYSAEISEIADRMRYHGEGFENNKAPDWKEQVQSIIGYARQNAMPRSVLLESAERSWQEMESIFDGNRPEGQKKPVSWEDWSKEFQSALRTDIQRMEANRKEKGKLGGASAAALRKLKSLNYRLQKNLPVSYDDLCVGLASINKPETQAGCLVELQALMEEFPYIKEVREDFRRFIKLCFECAAAALQIYQDFKKHSGLMDFADQESLLLEWFEKGKAGEIQSRIRHILVDEFQDTNPIQLALFLKLHKLAGQSTWVGDPKQSIYAFRGADPELMQSALPEDVEPATLGFSYRSTPELVDFANALFTPVFGRDDPKSVQLTSKRDDTPEGTQGLHHWYLSHTGRKSHAKLARSLARGIDQLLAGDPTLKASDIAVLCRANNTASKVAAGLEEAGIRASASQGKLLETREIQLAMAGLRYLLDSSDSLAVAEIVRLHADHPGHAESIQALFNARSLSRESLEALFEEWKSHALFQRLNQLRDRRFALDLPSAVRGVIHEMRLPFLVARWTNPDFRRQNLDAFSGAVQSYCQAQEALGWPAHLGGLIEHLLNADLPQAAGSGADAVTVMTYHGAKGLEWKVVILAELDHERAFRASGLNVVPAEDFNIEEPLAHRWIRFWPRPYHWKSDRPFFDKPLAESEIGGSMERRETRENQRLQYVGITRARDALIFAAGPRSSQDASPDDRWLEALRRQEGGSGAEFELPAGIPEDGNGSFIRVNGQNFPVTVAVHDGDSPPESQQGVRASQRRFVTGGEEAKDADPDLNGKLWQSVTARPRRISPSIVADMSSDSLVAEFRMEGQPAPSLIKSLGDPFSVSDDHDEVSLGEAVHGFLSLDLSMFSDGEQLDLAVELLRNWNVTDLDPSDLMAMSQRLQSWIAADYANATVRTEWPVTMVSEGQHMQGWIDLLIETPDRFIVIDHKSYSGGALEKKASEFGHQLYLYRAAISAAYPSKDIETLIHFPLLGKVYRVEF
ncbi:MAG: hypothetical protein CMN76_12840 [Spirochaetaceae bacterium]|nr:hypothetical protein [Spirochaetaceae bacterium]|tara:strand:+ start:25977 stop:29246 length:3270 start_codon:yes stop_codon:yes gene_type:complete